MKEILCIFHVFVFPRRVWDHEAEVLYVTNSIHSRFSSIYDRLLHVYICKTKHKFNYNDSNHENISRKQRN